MAEEEIKNDQAFDNRTFWNGRYEDNPALGSGVGSRGRNLLHKRAIIASFMEKVKPIDILDVGCGDLEVMSGLDLSVPYLGIDISPKIIEQHRRSYPQKAFACLDFAALSSVREFEADAVLCFEVLIHQHRCADYVRLLSNVVEATRKCGLVSGYVFNPRPAIRSEIIAWHEPIIDTLERVGARDVSVVASSLESQCLAFVSFLPRR